MKNYKFEDIIRVVKREKNKNRKFLFLNLLQGKYAPSNPQSTLELFETLGRKLAEKYDGEKVCLIGFAETATAIAAAVAGCFQQKVYFLHTTREELQQEYFVTEFQEEHSHAKQHCLYCEDKKVLQESDVLILVDDEFTTGKTVCNFVKSLKENHWMKEDCKVVAASLINCMKPEHLQRFSNEKIECDYLMHREDNWEKIDWKSNEGEKCTENKKKEISESNLKNEQTLQDNEVYIQKKNITLPHNRKCFDIIRLKGKKNPRQGVYQLEYKKACEKLTMDIVELLQLDEKKSEEILLLGTEECMYPAIYAADRIQKMYSQKQCFVHATSRSPIVALDEDGYPIYSRDNVISFYEKDRNVFIYNLKKYSQVVILTDAEQISEEAKSSIETIMQKYENDNCKLLQWVM